MQTRGDAKTTVVNLRRDKYDVYIGRPSPFGNPIILGQKCFVCGETHRERGSTLPCFRVYFQKRLCETEFNTRVQELRGKVLGCFCKPDKLCHGDIIAEYLNG